MKEVNRDIKEDKFKSIYLLYGDEDYLKRYYKNRLSSAISRGNSMNYTFLEGKNIDVDLFITKSQVMPFLADRKCIVIENSNWFKTTNEQVNKYIEHLPATTHVVFVEENVDERNKLFKKVKSMGYTLKLVHPDTKELIDWIERGVKSVGKSMSTANKYLLLEYVGNDMERLSNELAKLISYAGHNQFINRDDILEITSSSIESKVFELVSDMINKKISKALKLYNDMLALKESPYNILYLIARQFNQLLIVKDMSELGINSEKIAETINLKKFIVEKLIKQARGFDKNNLKNYLQMCVEMETRAKTGIIDDKNMITLLIVS